MRKAAFILLGLAIPFFSYCTTFNPDSSSYYLKQALQYEELKKTHEAQVSFKKAIDFSPSNHLLRFAYVEFLLKERKYFIAVEQLQKVLDLDENNNQALLKVVEVNFMLHKYADVIHYATRLPETNRINFMLGKSYYEEEDFGLSQKYLDKVVKETPRDFNAVILLGQVYIELSNYNAALALYNQALNLDDTNNELIYQLGLLYYAINNNSQAIYYWELAAERGYKQDIAFKENLGMAYLAIDLKKGIELLNKVLEKKPNDAEISYQIAHAHYKAKDFQSAAEGFYKVYENDKTNTRALYMTGIAYHKKGDKLLGDSYCEKAIKIDPSLAELKRLKYSN